MRNPAPTLWPRPVPFFWQWSSWVPAVSSMLLQQRHQPYDWITSRVSRDNALQGRGTYLAPSATALDFRLYWKFFDILPAIFFPVFASLAAVLFQKWAHLAPNLGTFCPEAVPLESFCCSSEATLILPRKLGSKSLKNKTAYWTAVH